MIASNISVRLFKFHTKSQKTLKVYDVKYALLRSKGWFNTTKLGIQQTSVRSLEGDGLPRLPSQDPIAYYIATWVRHPINISWVELSLCISPMSSGVFMGY